MLDPELGSFDVTLQESTNRVIRSLDTRVEDPQSLSFDSIREIVNCLLEMHQEVANFNLKCKEDIWNNQELFSFVEDYFENSLKTLDFCTALENCLMRTRDQQLIILFAVKHFEEEEEGVDSMKHLKTLQELRRFKAAGDPFTEEFFVLFESVYKQHVSLWEKLQLRKGNLDKKLGSVKTWRRVSKAIFVAAFVAMLVLSVVAAAIAAPPLVTTLAGSLSIPIGSVGKWCDSLWMRYEKALERQSEVISSMRDGTRITMTDLSNIRALVAKLEIEIESMSDKADFALREEETVKFVIDEIKEKLEAFIAAIHNLSEHAGRCSRDIVQARTIVLQTMFRRAND